MNVNAIAAVLERGGRIFWLAVAILMLASLAETQEKAKVPIKITTEKTEIAPPADGGRPPMFQVEAEPGRDIALFFATNIDFFEGLASSILKNHFSTYLGSEEAGLRPAALKTDHAGRLDYTLPDEVFAAMAGKGGRIYYVAAVIEPIDANAYEVLGLSFDYTSENPGEAPYVTVEETSTVLRAKEHFQAGQEHYDKEDYHAAIKEFEAAVALGSYPGFKYNIGVCYLRMAQKFLSDYLASGPSSEEQEKTLREFIAKIEDFIRDFNRRP